MQCPNLLARNNTNLVDMPLEINLSFNKIIEFFKHMYNSIFNTGKNLYKKDYYAQTF